MTEPYQVPAPEQQPYQPQETYQQAYAQPAAAPVVDNGGFGWGFLGFLIPLVGLILFLVWKDTKPKTAKAAGIGALVGVIVSVIFSILGFVLTLAAASMYSYY